MGMQKYFFVFVVLLCAIVSGCGGGGADSAKPITVSSAASSITSISSSASSANSQPACTDPVTPGEPVVVADDTLSAAIHTSLCIPMSTMLDTENMKRLTSLTATGSVTSLSGLEYAINLTSLTLHKDKAIASTFNDLKPLSSLKFLKSLSFETGRITSLDGLENVPLEFVDLNEMPLLQNINALAGKTIKHLVVVVSPLTSIDVFKKITFTTKDEVVVAMTCLTFKPGSASLSVWTWLQEKGIYGGYGSGNTARIGEVDCPVEPVFDPVVANPNLSLVAKYAKEGLLKLSWTWSGAVLPSGNLQCEFYPEIEFQIPRVPFKTVTNCPVSGNLDIPDLPYVGTRMTLVMKSSAGDTVTSTEIDKSLIDTSKPTISAIDWTQVVVKTTPKLVPNREALLRVHVTSANPLPVPALKLLLNLNNASEEVSTVQPKSLPADKKLLSTSDSYHYIVPAQWMKKGLKISLVLGDVVKTITPEFADERPIYITAIPIAANGLAAPTLTEEQIKESLISKWPLADVKVRISAPYNSPTTSKKLLNFLEEISEVQKMDGAENYYLGFYSRTNDVNYDVSGVAWLSGKTLISDANNFDTTAHEVGHLFGLEHINCVSPLIDVVLTDTDPKYPYNPDVKGSLSMSLDFQKLYLPSDYADIMSYCFPNHVSDYSYDKFQDYLQQNPPKPFKTAAPVKSQKLSMAASPSLYITGTIGAQDQVFIRRFMPLDGAPTNGTDTAYAVELISANGARSQHALEFPQLDHGAANEARYFSVVVPYMDVKTLNILHQGKVIFSETKDANASVKQKLTVAPEVTETNGEACAHWSGGAMASLRHVSTSGQSTTLALDAKSSPLCISTTGLEQGGMWRLQLSKGLINESYDYPR